MSEQESGLQPISDSQIEALEEAVTEYEQGLTVEAARYLMGRGLTEETVRTSRLGVVGDPLPGHEPYRGWISIPYLHDGKPLMVRFRRPDWIDSNSHKYGQPSGSKMRVYNVGAIHEARDEIHVCEGEFDALILQQCDLPAIAFPGANTFRGYHGRMLAGFNKIYVWADPDEAGAELLNVISNRLPRSTKGVRLQADVTDTYVAGGKDAIIDALMSR